ncbi:uncharacterized protein LOC128388988 isoform X2 [Panonychus citri]|uniref:uncharacterized protein LOC128388988 isoform X2 n=1 Tax=Panonychus citri TaxID=50023 RepID=UPI002307D177|nr:uncharacterized protein LOC128388988 isoform X2 [Panonychus citri]
MSFNDLPDICLWKIFENVHEAKDLIRWSQVCSRWSDLIRPRFKRVKYLRLIDNAVDYIDANSLWINPKTNWNYNLFKLFPNIKIINSAAFDYHGSFNLPEIVKNNPQIKGLVGMDNLSKDGYMENIEMCSAEFDFHYKKVFRPYQLKQVCCFRFRSYLPDGVFYNGPNLSSLKILEFGTTHFAQVFTGFHFMDFCPSLESAFFQCLAEDIYLDESIKNYNLRDLVIECHSDCFSWATLRRLLSKFPYLHHLRIMCIGVIKYSNLEELVKLLPELKILDLRGYNGVTHKTADFLSKYCVKENRSIVIYYDCENEPAEWPKLVETDEPICYGFDFMKHCFYKTFDSLPVLIDE